MTKCCFEPLGAYCRAPGPVHEPNDFLNESISQPVDLADPFIYSYVTNGALAVDSADVTATRHSPFLPGKEAVFTA